MGFYYLLTERGAPSPNREDFLVFLVILVVLDILYLTWGAGFHPEDSSSPSTCAFFSKNPRIPSTIILRRARRPPSRGGGDTSFINRPLSGNESVVRLSRSWVRDVLRHGTPYPQNTKKSSLVGLGAHPLGGWLYLHWG